MEALTVAAIIGLVLAAVEELNARGRSFVSWAVIVLCVGLLWGEVIK
jgi:hypothetical protein